MSVYSRLLGFKLREDELRENNYPRPHQSVSGKALLCNLSAPNYRIIPSAFKRNCKRCMKVYDINSDGVALYEEECLYHPYRVGGGKFPRHRCCNGGLGSRPCAKASQHISEDIDPDKLCGFSTTKYNHVIPSKNIYAIDCEMVCTKAGLELAAISVVDSSCNVVYETLVLPDNPVIDYLTEHSNLDARDLRGVTTRLVDVHRKILTLFGEDTILVGHGLNHDLLALKLIHDTIVDTVVAYPHPKGRGFRNSLGFLKDRYLPSWLPSRSDGLKCRGDALLAMKLALLKAK